MYPFDNDHVYERYLISCGSCGNEQYINILKGIPSYPSKEERRCPICGYVCKATKCNRGFAVKLGSKFYSDDEVLKNVSRG